MKIKYILNMKYEGLINLITIEQKFRILKIYKTLDLFIYDYKEAAKRSCPML